jgi:hypothetical protein
MFTIMRRRAVRRNTRTPTFKINVWLLGQRFTWSYIRYILCPVHNFYIVYVILKLIGTNGQNYGILWHVQDPDLQGQGHIWRSKLNVVFPGLIFSLFRWFWSYLFKGCWNCLTKMFKIMKRDVMRNTRTLHSRYMSHLWVKT